MRTLGYELRAVGAGLFALPLLVTGVFTGATLLAAYNLARVGAAESAVHHDVGRGLLYLLEFGLPPVCGFAAASLIASNPAKELHFSLPTGYASVMWRRLALFTLWATGVGAGACLLVQALDYWIAPQPAPLNHLTWLAPLLWYIAAGALLALLLGSWVASTSILGMLWLGELLFRPFFLRDEALRDTYLFLTVATLRDGGAPDAAYWLTNRLALLGMAALFLLGVALLLRRNQAILNHEN